MRPTRRRRKVWETIIRTISDIPLKIMYPHSRSPLLGHRAEGSHDFLVQLCKCLLKELVGVLWHLELHRSQLNELRLQGCGDGIPADLLLSRALSNCLLAALMKAHNVPHHADCLCQGAPEVILAEAVLLQEIFTNDLCNVKSALLILRE